MLEGKVQLGRIRCKREDNIKRNLVEVECESAGWIHLPHSRFQCRIPAAFFMLVSCVLFFDRED
jgi:hypothetical protein